jgi:hypothetical protein
MLLLAGTLAVLAADPWLGAQGPNFDRLSDADRSVLAERFRREVWPLLERGGKNGCVGCHNGKIVSSLRMSGDADRDFRMMVRDGFFLKGDAGSLLARVLDTDKKRRMPPPSKGPAWGQADVKVLSDFVNDLHKKQKP